MKEKSSLLSSSSCGFGSKKEQRLERKKRKILALAELMQLNERDRSSSAVSSTITPTIVQQEQHTSVGSTVECGSQLEPEQKKAKLTDPQYLALKAEVKQRRDRMRNVPKIRLKEVGEEALMKANPESRVPLLLDDIQALLMHCLLRTDSPMNFSRWAVLEKSAKLTHTAVLLIEGLTADDFVEYEQDFRECRKIFHNILEVVTPCNRLAEELTCVAITESHKDILLAEYGSLEAAMLVCKDQMLIRKSIFDDIRWSEVDANVRYEKADLPPGDNFPRTQLLLSPVQMINEDYPLPLTGCLKSRYADYITTNDHYEPVTPKSPMFGLDCEMCKTNIGASELARVSIIDEQGNEFYESLVRPENKIVDYLTKFSGITAEKMRNVTKRLKDVHRELKNKLPPDAILVGQSLNFDLHALKVMHPYVIDTSILFNVTGTSGTKAKLKALAKEFLKRDIQCSSSGHNSIEDCSASLELVKLKLSQNIYFGDRWLMDRRNYHRKASKIGSVAHEEVQKNGTNVNTNEITSTLFGHSRKRNKKSILLTNADNVENVANYFGENKPSNAELKKLLTFEKLAHDQAVIEHTVDKCLNYDFNLSYIQLKTEDLVSAESKKAKIDQIDAWVRKLYSAISLNGLLVVLLAGGDVNPSSRMAVAMVQTKKG